MIVTKLNAYSDQGVDDRWCTAHTALFTCSAYRAGDGQLFNIIVYAMYLWRVGCCRSYQYGELKLTPRFRYGS